MWIRSPGSWIHEKRESSRGRGCRSLRVRRRASESESPGGTQEGEDKGETKDMDRKRTLPSTVQAIDKGANETPNLISKGAFEALPAINQESKQAINFKGSSAFLCHKGAEKSSILAPKQEPGLLIAPSCNGGTSKNSPPGPLIFLTS